MNRFALTLAAALLASAPVLAADDPADTLEQIRRINGVESKIGEIVADSTTAKDNTTTAAPFAISAQWVVKIQCTVAGYIHPTTTATAVNAPQTVARGERIFIFPRGQTPKISVLSVSGSITCEVWRML